MNPLTDRLQQNSPTSIRGVLNLLKSRNADDVANNMYQVNPSFRRFVDANRGKSVQQIANENGLNLDQIQNMLR